MRSGGAIDAAASPAGGGLSAAGAVARLDQVAAPAANETATKIQEKSTTVLM